MPTWSGVAFENRQTAEAYPTSYSSSTPESYLIEARRCEDDPCTDLLELFRQLVRRKIFQRHEQSDSCSAKVGSGAEAECKFQPEILLAVVRGVRGQLMAAQ